MWEIGADQGRPRLTGHADSVQDVAFSPDGRFLASAGGYDHTVLVWEVSTGTVAHTLTGHTGTVTRVAFNRDGTLLASAGADIKQKSIFPLGTPSGREGRTDRTVRLWNVSDGSEAGTLIGHTEGVQDVAYSPEAENLLASAALASGFRRELPVVIRLHEKSAFDLGQ